MLCLRSRTNRAYRVIAAAATGSHPLPCHHPIRQWRAGGRQKCHTNNSAIEPGSKRVVCAASSKCWVAAPFWGPARSRLAKKLEAILVAPAARCQRPTSVLHPLTDRIKPPGLAPSPSYCPAPSCHSTPSTPSFLRPVCCNATLLSAVQATSLQPFVWASSSF